MKADPSFSGSAAEIIHFSRVKPCGGSKWAPNFGGPVQVAAGGTATIELQGATVFPDGTIAPADPAFAAQDIAVFPLAAGPRVSLGRFLIGRLATGILLAEGQGRVSFCGPGLSRHQIEILARLGLLGDYIVLAAPTRFRTVICPVASSPHTVPGPHVRTLANRLRSEPGESGARIAILPPRETETFALANRASLTAWLRARRITVIEPEAMPLTGLCSLLASASLVILADSSQAGLLGLCAPGAKILEIAPEGWMEAKSRQMCSLFGHGWTPFLASAPQYPLLTSIAFGARVPLSYEVPIRDLAKTLDMLGSESPARVI